MGMPKSEKSRELETFSKKVLVHFIREKVWGHDIINELKELERSLRMEEINDKIEKLVQKSEKYYGIQNYPQWQAIHDEIDILHEEWLKIQRR